MKITLISLSIRVLGKSLPVQIDEIVGGIPVEPPFKYPWMVHLEKDKKWWCGGVLLNKDTVLTAGHCSNPSQVTPGPTLKVYAHRHNLEVSFAAENSLEFETIKIVRHPKFNQWNFRFDIAVWKVKLLSGDMALVNTTLKLDNSTLTRTGTPLTVLGWGTQSFQGQRSPLLQQVVVPVVNDAECFEIYEPQEYDESSFCAGYPKGGKDACQGDSGGPIFSVENGVAVLAGLVSYGKGCASPGFPGVYSRIHLATDWITTMMQ